MSGPSNPFRAPDQAPTRAKLLVYGPSGVGKTFLALSAPGRIAVIDTEGGTAFYADRPGLSKFDVLPTKTFAQVEQAVAYLKANPGVYETLVIDPVTVLYETLQDAAQQRRADQRRNVDADLEMLDWQHIKRAYKRLMNELVNLPMHVVVTAREADLKEERTSSSGRKESVKIGLKPSAEKDTDYHFDTVVRLEAGKGGARVGVVEKDRTGEWPLMARVPDPTFGVLFSKALSGGGSAGRSVPSDEGAARVDAATTIAGEQLVERDESLTRVGRITRTGTVARGDGVRSDLMARQQPDGTLIGFRLEVGDGKAIPQVIAHGALGTALLAACGGDTNALVRTGVEVSGELYEVQPPGRRKYHRLVADRIKGDDFEIPASDAQPGAEAASVPMFSDEEQAAIDAALGVVS